MVLALVVALMPALVVVLAVVPMLALVVAGAMAVGKGLTTGVCATWVVGVPDARVDVCAARVDAPTARVDAPGEWSAARDCRERAARRWWVACFVPPCKRVAPSAEDEAKASSSRASVAVRRRNDRGVGIGTLLAGAWVPVWARRTCPRAFTPAWTL